MTHAERRVVSIVAGHFSVPEEKVRLDDPLMGPTLNADDLDIVELIMDVEDEFGTEITDHALEALVGKPFSAASKHLTPRHLAQLASCPTTQPTQPTSGRADGDGEIAAPSPRLLAVELFFDSSPAIDKEKLLAAMRYRCGNVEMAEMKPGGTVVMFLHRDHTTTFKEGKVPAQFVLLPADEGKAKQGDYTAAFQQSRAWPDARETVNGCRYTLLATDMMARPLPYKERLSIFRNGLRALLETVPCKAVFFQGGNQFLRPEQFLRSFTKDGSDPLLGVVNVRLFRATGSGDIVMDTLGLTELGLPDLQCHFRTLPPGKVAAMLYNTAQYIYEKGDVIQDGHTVQGLFPGDKWSCRHEASLVKPNRVVIDINPGPTRAAGKRR